MTDPWSRDGVADRSRGPVFEISLEGDGPLVESAADLDAGVRPPSPNWRRVVGTASIMGVVLGVVVAIGLLVFNGDGSDDQQGDGATGTTVEPTGLTTPPTLSPLEPLPRPDQPNTSELGPFERTVLTVPGYPEVAAGSADIPGSLPLTAITELSDDVPRRSVTRFQSTVAEDGVSLTITRDPATDRYELLFQPTVTVSPDIEFTILVDVATRSLYQSTTALAGSSNRWIRQSFEELAANTGVFEDFGTFMRQMLLGPIRPDTFAAVSEVEPGPLVDIQPTPGVVRRSTVRMPATSVPEWAHFAFGPRGETPVDDDEVIEYEVYVDQAGSIVRVQGVNRFGNESQSIIHSIETLGSTVAIELPNDDQIVSAEEWFDRAPSSEALRPEYGVMTDGVERSVDVAAALDRLAADPPVRSVVTDINSSASFTITTEFDAADDLTATTYELSDPGTLVIREIEDPSGGRVLRQNRSDERWVSESIESRGSAADVRYLTGLISPAELQGADLASGGTAFYLDDGTLVIETELAIDPSAIDLPIDVSVQLLMDRPVTVYLYIDEENRVRELQILSNSDGSPEVVVQRFVYLDEAPVVTLPDPADVDPA